MKTIFALICFLLCASIYAATPTFQTFNTNQFVGDASANTIRANTNSSNPNALVSQAQFSGGGSTPNGLVTNSAPANVIVTNAGVNTTITSNTVTSGSLIANGGTSNYLGGITLISSNAAPFSTVSPSGLNSIALNQRWTNDFNRRATLILNMTYFTNGGISDNIIKLAFTNTVTGECYTNSGSGLQFGVGENHLIFPGISPGDYGSISNYSTGTGGPTVTIAKAWWKLE